MLFRSCGAVLRDADLRGADLRDADLRDAKTNDETQWPHFQIPQEGELTVWGKKAGKLVKMRVPPEAKRTASIIGRKCRAEYVETLWIQDDDIRTITTDRQCTYTVGEKTFPDSYDDNPKVKCSHGIHFFLTKEEAMEWDG